MSLIRPACQVEGCTNSAQLVTNLQNPKFRKSKWVAKKYGVEGFVCSQHHIGNISKNHGGKSLPLIIASNAGFETVRAHEEHQASEAGFQSVTAWKNSSHPYLKYRKTWCENRDGRIGFTCTFTPPPSYVLEGIGLQRDFMGWLQVDHINGNHLDNRTENLQTLCANCHNVKTFQAGDYATPGRKTRKAEPLLRLVA
tara:strand:+ start:5458 stop:6048 length:591 start_codon:yes stop_codon:yes gene_type:complete